MKFRKSKSTGEGFEQINIRVSPDIKQIIDAEAKDQNQSVATFVYTALFWWSWYIWPPKTKLSKEWQDFFIQYPEKFEAELKESFFGAKEVEG